MMNAVERSDDVVEWPGRKPPKISERESIKKLKVHGEAHVNHVGKSIPEATVGQDRRCKRIKCFENVNEDERRHIFNQFYLLDYKDKQDSFIFSCISYSPVQRKRPRRQSPDDIHTFDHNVSFEYKLRVNQTEKKVCHVAFLSILSITRSKLRRIQDIAVNERSLPKDARGTHSNRPNKFPAPLAEIIMSHLRSFKARQSHYSLRQNRNRMFLPETLNVKKMHNIFLQEYCIQIPYKTYYNIFHSKFNIKFGLPRSDTCAVCDSLKLNIASAENDTVKKEILIKKDLHLRKAAKFRELKKKYQLLAREGKCMVISFDYMQNLPLPHIKTGDVFYARQLWYYVFGLHDLADNNASMYVYTETIGKKGANEITSMLLHYLKNRTITSDTLIILSGGCAGQNENHVMVYFQYILVYSLKLFEKIKHIFAIRGHSYMPNDQDFALIEKKKRTHCPEVPTDWDELIREARVSPSPFKVIKMTHENFIDATKRS